MVLKGIGPDGLTPPHDGNVLLTRGVWVLCSSAFERLAYYTMTTPLSIYFTRVWSMDSVRSQQMQAIFQSIVYLLPILGALIADTWSGRYLISVTCLACSTIGAALWMVGTINQTSKGLAIAACLAIFAAPVAMVKPNLIVLGADQFNENKPDQLKQRGLFFGVQYWTTNIGSAIAAFLFASIAVNGLGSISGNFAFSFVLILGTVFEGISFLFILFGGKLLFAPKPQGSPLMGFVKVTFAALKKAPTMTGWFVLAGTIGNLLMLIVAVPSFFVGSQAYSIVMGCLVLALCGVCVLFGRNSDWVRNAAISKPGVFSDESINGAADVYRLTPYFAFAIPFWAVYNCMNTSFIAQGCQMKSAWLASSAMQGFDAGIIVILIPIFNKFLYPFSDKFMKGKFSMTLLRRIGCGMFVTGLAMLVGAIIEYARRNAGPYMVDCKSENEDFTNDKYWPVCDQQYAHYKGGKVPAQSTCYTYNKNMEDVLNGTVELSPVSDLSIFVQIVSYCLVGVGEILTAISMIDFFYSQAPDFIRAVCQAFQFLTVAMGTLVGAVVTAICAPFVKQNLDEGHQEYLYFINMGLCWGFLILFAIVSPGFRYKPGTSGGVDPDDPEGILAEEARRIEEEGKVANQDPISVSGEYEYENDDKAE